MAAASISRVTTAHTPEMWRVAWANTERATIENRGR